MYRGGETGDPLRVGVVGTGFIARGFMMALGGQEGMVPGPVLTRRASDGLSGLPKNFKPTNAVEDLIEGSDLVVECSGHVLHATEVIEEVMAAGLPVVTMDAETQVTTGSYFAKKGVFSEAEGDQPGCIAALREEALQMGFVPLVYGNIKGYLNHNPTPEEMDYWGKKQGISLDKVTSFTDGTKVQVEQALVANGLGAGIIRPGLLGPGTQDLTAGAEVLAETAILAGEPVSDFILSPGAPAGVFIAALHDDRFKGYLSNFKMGEGPVYTLIRNFHLCNLEITKTIRRIADGGEPLLNNGPAPAISVATIAKTDLQPGQEIRQGMGSFAVRGSTVRTAEIPEHVPIGLVYDAKVRRKVKAGSVLTWDDLEIPESRAREIWLELQGR
ncbi:NAD(P)-dependent oxidoreductase [Methanofollis formosanus]|uniref:NAD(P)-dependent oxidoreductase n=1 Tax=Methanofollis formosanus TaxID=299308 RepID=A0A8G0ZZD5_9EURY|nr:SAF domain-containing protein [Methanofollis formosanus]QYZ78335.1 NAD(P)-dependent oxidoreductase [Methanofollis formosanus]